ncbi:MAG: ferredoxin family protein [Firmicutes bacterium]|nr:ferredoxin family protein [Bacillota bacterium]
MAKPANYFYDSKIHIITQWCKGCGICTLLCKNNVLTLDSRKKAVVANPAACTACGHCENHCPDIAIRVSRPAAKSNARIPVAPVS